MSIHNHNSRSRVQNITIIYNEIEDKCAFNFKSKRGGIYEEKDEKASKTRKNESKHTNDGNYTQKGVNNFREGASNNCGTKSICGDRKEERKGMSYDKINNLHRSEELNSDKLSIFKIKFKTIFSSRIRFSVFQAFCGMFKLLKRASISENTSKFIYFYLIFF